MKKFEEQNTHIKENIEIVYTPEEQEFKQKIENKAKGYYLLTKAIQLAKDISNEYGKSKAIAGIAQIEAEHGNIDKAIQLTEDISNGEHKIMAITGIVQTKAGYGKIDKLIQLAEGINNEFHKSKAIAGIVQIEAEHGNIDKAIRLTEDISDKDDKSKAIAGIAQAEAKHGNIDKAIRLTENISDVNYKSKAIAGIAQTKAGYGKIDKLIQLTENIGDEFYRANLIASIAQTKAGGEKIDKLIQLAENMNDEKHKEKHMASAFAGIAQTEAGYEKMDKLMQIVGNMNDKFCKIIIMAEIAQAEAKHGNIDKAIRFTKNINDEFHRANVIVNIAQTEAGHKKIDKLIQLVGNISGEKRKTEAIVGIAQTKAGGEKIDKLIQLAEDISDKYCKSEAIAGIAQTEAGYKKIDRLIQLAGNIGRLCGANAMAKIAQIEAKHGNIGKAMQLAENIGDEEHKTGAIVGIAQTKAKYGSKLIIENDVDLKDKQEEIKNIFNKALQINDKNLIQSLGMLLDNKTKSELSSSLSDESKKYIQRQFNIVLTETRSEILKDSEKNELKNKYQEELNEFLKEASEHGKLKNIIQTGLIGRILHNLDTNEANQVLLETSREYINDLNNPALLTLFKHLIESSGFRGQDVAKQLLANNELPDSRAWWLLHKLGEANYFNSELYDELKKDIKDKKALPNESSSKNKQRYLQGIRLIINDLHINPDKEVIDYLINKEWEDEKDNDIEGLEARINKIQEYKQEFEQYTNKDDLLKALAEDAQKALLYHILNGGKTKFALVNSYNFDKFKDILNTANQFEKHEEPINRFKEQLKNSGFSEDETNNIVTNLEQGHYPFANKENPEFVQEIRIDVSDNTKLESANKELSEIMGRGQLGIILRTPLYREYLKDKNDQKLLDQLGQQSSFSEREHILEQIEQKYSDIKETAKKQLQSNWKKFGEKMILNISLDSVFEESRNPIDGLDIIPKIEQRKMSLSGASKELLSMLRGENPKIKAMQNKINKTKKALKDIRQGYGKTKKSGLKEKIKQMEKQIENHKEELNKIISEKAVDRWSELDKKEKQELIEKQSQRIKALEEKDPTAIFTYLLAETIGEDRFINGDIELLKEFKSHLDGPFQMLHDLANLKTLSGAKEKKVRLRYIDKLKDLCTALRFADSKTCCFMSTNYNMQIAHNTPNKEWVASIVKDPLSFIFEIEDSKSRSEQKKNLGFVFGSFGIDKSSNEQGLVVMLNGVYLSTGNDSISSLSITKAIEDSLSKKIKAKKQVIASRYGGSTDYSKEYNNKSIEIYRLRALDDGNGKPETKIYDDLNIQPNQDGQMTDKNVWWEDIEFI